MTTDSATPIVPVILSGGAGSRLWPQSREQYPKQLLALTSEHTLIQESVLRVQGGDLFGPAVIVCNDDQRFIIAEQMRAIGAVTRSIIVEPVARNTAAAIAAAAWFIAPKDPDALMLVAPADHLITDREAFLIAVRRGAAAALEGKLVTFGMTPNFPETGYGYIRRGQATPAEGVFTVAQFVEKPTRDVAEQYLQSGEFFWNSGIFLFSAGAFLKELEAHAPEIWAQSRQAVEQAKGDLDFLRLDHAAFAACPSNSIDYAVMEHTARAVVVPARMGWTDIGSWSALWDVATKDADGNAWLGDVIVEGSRGCYVDSAQMLTAIVGLENIIVVSTADAVLVAAKDKAQDVKKIVESLKRDGRMEHVVHRRVHRPWGNYDTVFESGHCQVRHIHVAQGGTVALQKHAHRAEHWVVVRGRATVTRGDEQFEAVENQSVWIPTGAPHRLENRGSEPLELIEVQSGETLDENDIERLENAY